MMLQLTPHRLFRQAVLGVAARPGVVQWVSRHGLQLGARRFVAGETLEDGLTVATALRKAGRLITLNCLGEKVTDARSADDAARTYIRILEALAQAGHSPNISVKLSQLGLQLDPAACRRRLREVVAGAAHQGGFVRVDMEESSLVDLTLEAVLEVHRDYPERIGPVLQAYLYRSAADLQRLLAQTAGHGLNVRLCKGAYSEPPSVAYPRKRDVDENFRRLAAMAIDGGAYLALATHDERLIREIAGKAREGRAGAPRFEVQMLYGVRPQLQQTLVEAGYHLRVYVPFGTQWYPYFVRRLAERPANLAFVLRGLWG